MPLCDGTACTATGNYINDDGVTTDLTQRKEFSFVYSHNISTTAGAAPDMMQIDILSSGNKDVINANDLLGGLQIYDYTHLNFTGAEYSVSIEPADGDSGDVGVTEFSIRDDRLVWNSSSGEFSNTIVLM